MSRYLMKCQLLFYKMFLILVSRILQVKKDYFEHVASKLIFVESDQNGDLFRHMAFQQKGQVSSPFKTSM